MENERVMITLPKGLRDRAHLHGFNVSRLAANAITKSLEAIEKETGINPSQSVPAASSERNA